MKDQYTLWRSVYNADMCKIIYDGIFSYLGNKCEHLKYYSEIEDFMCDAKSHYLGQH